MAGRFTRAAVVDYKPKIHEGLHTPSAESINAKEEGEKNEGEERLGLRDGAARTGIYGDLTRDVVVWFPSKLLCKRFGAEDPNPPTNDPPDPPPSILTPDPSTSTEALTEVATTSFALEPSKDGGKRDLANDGLAEDETQGKDILTYERPSMDIFEAIFASDNKSRDGDGHPTSLCMFLGRSWIFAPFI
jgi:G patch domain-containing protein 1